jgi:bis(5'-nucleosyl)-tetraphosphatase (symmetrical)
MPTYCIGDVQGCFTELLELLQLLSFDENKDELWFVGDLVNRGPNSLEVLRFVKKLPKKVVVLGNHDFHLLAVYHNLTHPRSHNLDDVLKAKDGAELINWLRLQSLLHYSKTFNAVLVHAGILPEWNLYTARRCALEVEEVLHGNNYIELLKHIYGNKPFKWNSKLRGWSRLRFIINSFTRMRFCDKEGNLDFHHQCKVGDQPKGLLPWFNLPRRKIKNIDVVFGHWAALEGKVNKPWLYALDTGCIWGNSLTALRLEDKKIFQVKCNKKYQRVNF